MLMGELLVKHRGYIFNPERMFTEDGFQKGLKAGFAGLRKLVALI